MHVAQCIKNCLALERIRHLRNSDLHANVKQMLLDSLITEEHQKSILVELEAIPHDKKFAWLEYLFHLILSGFAKKYPPSDLVPLLNLAFERKTTKLSLHNIQIAFILLKAKPNLTAEEINAAKPLTYAAINEQHIPLDCIKNLAKLINFYEFQLAGVEQQLRSNSYFGLTHCLNYGRLILFNVDLNYFGAHIAHVYEMLAFHSLRAPRHTVEYKILTDARLSIERRLLEGDQAEEEIRPRRHSI